MADNVLRNGPPGMDTQEVDGSHLAEALAHAGHEAGEASQEEIDQLLKEEDLSKVDITREIDTNEIREQMKRMKVSR